MKIIQIKLLPVIFILFLATSCSFNKMFLRPTVLNPHTREITLNTPTDTIIVYFSDSLYQPTITRNGTDTVDLDYMIESVIFENSEGKLLNGWFVKSKNEPARITVLHLHGNSGCLVNNIRKDSPLSKNGFQLFLFDYSGFGFSEGKATRKNVLKDALSALDYVKSRPDVNGTKLIIYGQSLGGHLSAVVAAKRQDDIDALVIEGGFSSHKDIAADRAGFIARILVKQGYSATKSIHDYHKPLLVIHSIDDKVVPFYMGEKIFDNANEPKEFYEIKECHICGLQYYPDEITGKIKSMLYKK